MWITSFVSKPLSTSIWITIFKLSAQAIKINLPFRTVNNMVRLQIIICYDILNAGSASLRSAALICKNCNAILVGMIYVVALIEIIY